MTDTRLAHQKPEPRRKTKRRIAKPRAEFVAEIRVYVFARERNVCRCCRIRAAESMHELVARSVGGKVSRRNSVALCGDGARGCHGFCQRHQVIFGGDELRAESTLTFTPTTKEAAEWLRIQLGERIESPPMRECEPIAEASC